MANSSSAGVPASLSLPVAEKLTRENYRLWRAQVLSAIRAAQLEGLLDGSEKASEKTLEIEKDSKQLKITNPDYVTWNVRDQRVLTYLVTSLSREVLAGVASNSTAATMWAAITRNFASQSRSRVLHLRNKLAATRKGDMSIATYFSTVRGLADEMACVGKPLDDDDVMSHVLNGLDADYNPLIENINGMSELIGLDDLYSRLLDAEARILSQKAQKDKEQFEIVANAAASGNSGNKQGGGHYGGNSGNRNNSGNRGNPGSGRPGGGRGGNPNNPYKDHQC